MTTIGEKIAEVRSGDDPRARLGTLCDLRDECRASLIAVENAIAVERMGWTLVPRAARPTRDPSGDYAEELAVVRKLLEYTGGFVHYDAAGWRDALGLESGVNLPQRLKRIARDVGGVLMRNGDRWAVEL